jgi:two-component system, chemotaxis family, protein-glutamate methylesterase/glutaminase
MALKNAIELDKEIEVVGEAFSGAEALKLIARRRPDLVTMDIYLHGENGIDVTSAIMSKLPVPILVITGINPHDPNLIFKAMNAGALEVRAKLPSRNSSSFEQERLRLVRLIKSLYRVPVITRRGQKPKKKSKAIADSSAKVITPVKESAGYSILAIGASTGGPPLIQELLNKISSPFPFPIVIVQHISVGFCHGLAKWLSETTGHSVEVCEQNTDLSPGKVYFAPDDRHLVLQSTKTLTLSSKPARMHQRPAIDELFESVASVFGKSAMGILLTGMGSDGAKGLVALHKAGAMTIAQQPESCTVASMPQSAIALNATDLILHPNEIAKTVETKFKI